MKHKLRRKSWTGRLRCLKRPGSRDCCISLESLNQTLVRTQAYRSAVQQALASNTPYEINFEIGRGGRSNTVIDHGTPWFDSENTKGEKETVSTSNEKRSCSETDSKGLLQSEIDSKGLLQ